MIKRLLKLLHLTKSMDKKQFSPGCRLQTIISQNLYTNGFELYIYNTKANMMKGIKKWLIKNHYQNTEVSQDMLGVVYEYTKLKSVEYEDDNFQVFGAMFLNEPYLTMDIIAHECVHAAMTLERNVIRYMGVYDGNDGSGQAPEERLAYTIGSFIDNILRACIKKKINVKLVYEKTK